MRITMAFVMVAALSFGTSAWAQAQREQPKSPPQGEFDQSDAIWSIQVVDIKDLTPELRLRVKNVVAKASEEDLRKASGFHRRVTGGGIRSQGEGPEL